MAKVKTATTTPVRRKGKSFKNKRNKVTKRDDFIPFSDTPEENENEESANWYQDEDAYRRLSSIQPHRDWDEEDGLNVWWNWGN